MATGNKIIILCREADANMFPFDTQVPCTLPIANRTSLAILLERLCKKYREEIVIIAPDDVEIEQMAMRNQVSFKKRNERYIEQIYEESYGQSKLLILHGEMLLHNKDIEKLILAFEKDENYLMTHQLDRYTQSTDVIACSIHGNIEAIYAHAREHYVNAITGKGYVLQKDCFPYLQFAKRGFQNINCGQMPNDEYYIEDAIQTAIEDGIAFYPLFTEYEYAYLKFPWDIAKANMLGAKWLTQFDEKEPITVLDDKTCSSHGSLRIGKHVVIQDHVQFEGNCVIGNDVVIEKGAIIGKHCVIGDGSHLSYGCKIADYSVVGPNNKIGYHAEFSGVSFKGVCAIHACEVFGVIGRSVDIAAGVVMGILRFDDMHVSQYVDKKRYVNLYTNTIFIGDYCRTGIHTSFLPGVKIGSRCAIGPGVVVEQDVEKNSLLLLKQDVIVKEWGSNRYGW